MLIYFKTPNASPTQQTKIGFVTGKKIGNSVVRHRHARRLREIVREYLRENENALSGTDMTYISHQLPDSFDSLKAELIGQLDEAERRSRNS